VAKTQEIVLMYVKGKAPFMKCESFS